MKLAAKADVIVENFRPEVKHRLGIDCDSLAAKNEGLVYASISGFDRMGRWPTDPDLTRSPKAWADRCRSPANLGAAPCALAFQLPIYVPGCLAHKPFSLRYSNVQNPKKASGCKHHCYRHDIYVDFQASRFLMDGDIPKQAGNNYPQSIPTGVFATNDGTINIAVAGEQIWQRFADALGKLEWKGDERFSINEARSADGKSQHQVEANITTNSTFYWVSALNKRASQLARLIALIRFLIMPKSGIWGLHKM